MWVISIENQELLRYRVTMSVSHARARCSPSNHPRCEYCVAGVPVEASVVALLILARFGWLQGAWPLRILPAYSKTIQIQSLRRPIVQQRKYLRSICLLIFRYHLLSTENACAAVVEFCLLEQADCQHEGTTMRT